MNVKSRRWSVNQIQIALLTGSLALLTGCSSTKAPVGPPLDRITEWNGNPEYYPGKEEHILRWLNSDTPDSILHTPEMRWKNGFAACMDPFMVDWSRSDLSKSDDGFIYIYNVLVSGNPILGTSRNATIRVPANGIERVELVVVRYSLKGLAKTGGHVQLRFVFKEDRRPELFGADGNPDSMQPYLDDLMVSWEAWRPSNTAWQFIAGLDPDNYALTARMYSGNQRFLNDSLRGAVWDCYPLQLPDVPDAEEKIFNSCLMLGDAMTRRTFTSMIKDQLIHEKGDDFTQGWSAEEKERARARLTWDALPDIWLKERLLNTDFSYNALQRSCITAALYQIELGMEWIYRENELGEREKIVCAPAGDLPVWFTNAAKGDSSGKYIRFPGALLWALKNKEIFPYKSYRPLEKLHLLETNKKGKVIMYRYDHKNGSPYGELRRNLM